MFIVVYIAYIYTLSWGLHIQYNNETYTMLYIYYVYDYQIYIPDPPVDELSKHKPDWIYLGEWNVCLFCHNPNEMRNWGRVAMPYHASSPFKRKD